MTTIIPGSIGGIIVSLQKLQLPIRTVSNSTTILDTDFTLEVDASGGSVTITLPTAASQFNAVSHIGTLYNIKKIDSTGNAITIQPQGTDTIDGFANIPITAQNVNYLIQSDGARWVIL